MDSPESAAGTAPPLVVEIGGEDVPVVVSAAALAEALGGVDTELVVLSGAVPPPGGQVSAMVRLREPGGWVARAVPVTDALKVVEGGMVTGEIDRSSVVVLRLPVLVETAVARHIAEAAGKDEVDLIEALAAAGPGAAYTGDEPLP